MPIGEPHPLRSESIDMRRGDLTPFRIVALDISVTEVVRVDHDHIGSFRWRIVRRQCRRHAGNEGTRRSQFDCELQKFSSHNFSRCFDRLRSDLLLNEGKPVAVPAYTVDGI